MIAYRVGAWMPIDGVWANLRSSGHLAHGCRDFLRQKGTFMLGKKNESLRRLLRCITRRPVGRSFRNVRPQIESLEERIMLSSTPGTGGQLTPTDFGSIVPIVSQTGNISLSVDGLGTLASSGTIRVQKPVGATVRAAYLAAASTGFTGFQIPNGAITLDGSPVTWSITTPSNIASYNSWADVTEIVKPTIDAATPGTVTIPVAEGADSGLIDGEILTVVFDDPNQTTSNTVLLLFGAQNVAGDTFAVRLADPINKSDPNLLLDMSLGISFGFQTPSFDTGQWSIVNVNGQRLTSSAGGQDDGQDANGALLTVGGIGDTDANPTDPLTHWVSGQGDRTDDELYDLRPFVNNGDTTINVFTQNPSNDDNIFFAALDLHATTAVVGEGVVLSPTVAAHGLGDQDTITATLQDTNGHPLANRQVAFTIVHGPNAGKTFTAASDANGQATFTYTSQTVGNDEIQASFVNSQGKMVLSNTVVDKWLAPPKVTSIVVDDGTPQRSMVRSVTVNFQEPVALDPGAFQLNLPAGVQPVTLSVTPALGNGTFSQSYVVTFSGPGIIGNSLQDGEYVLNVVASKVHNTADQTMAMDTPLAFFRLFADYTGNGFVDNLDLAYLRLAAGGNANYTQYFDYNGDGVVNATDTAQAIARRYTNIFTSDKTPPVVAYTGPDAGSATHTNPAVTGLVTDNLSGVASLKGQIDNGPTFAVPFDLSGSFSFTTALPLDGSADGSHTIHLIATDNAGNVSAQYNDTFVLDTTPPVVTYTNPAPGTATRTNPTVTGVVTDLTGVAALQGQIDNGPIFNVAFDPLGNFSFATTLALNGTADGIHTVHLVATDGLGNVSASYNDTFLLDTRPPVVTYSAPAPGTVTNKNPTINGQVTDTGAGLASLQGQIDDGSTFVVSFDATGNFSFATNLPLDGTADGSHTVHLRGTDQAGNLSGSFDISFTLDTTPPVVTYTSPAAGAVTDTTTRITGLVTDNVSGVESLVGQIDTGSTFPVTVSAGGKFSFPSALPLDGSADGPHTVHLIATDLAGNVSGSFDLTFVLDTTPVLTDPALAGAVRKTLNLPTNTRITKSVLSQLTTLSADSNLVLSLVGLQYATNLQSFNLIPSDWSLPGHITELSPLSGLSGLKSLALVKAGITNGELSALSSLNGLQSLDLRYDAISDISAVAGLPALSTLHLYADPVTDLSPLAGKLVTIDLPPSGADSASTIPALAQALQESPIEIFQYIVNNFTYQPYSGAKKGAQAALETRAGNDWDLDSLLAALLGQAGVTSRYVTGTINVPLATVENWLGVTDAGAAGSVLANAGRNPVAILDGNSQVVSYQFDHAWLEAQLRVPGVGQQWVALDPSWKFKDYQPGVADMLSLVPYSENAFLGQTQTELPYEYYENQVASYLAANLPSVSLADVAHDGPIHSQVFSTLPAALPYTIVGATTTYAQIPSTLTFRVGLTLSQGSTTLFQQILSLPDMSLERVTIGYAPAAGGLLTPELLVGGQVVAQGPAIANRSSVHLEVDHYDPGSTTVTQTFGYDRLAGQYVAVGLDAGQISNAYLAAQQADINTAAIAARDGAAFTTEDQVGAFLSLAIGTYFYNSDVADQVTDGLAQAVPVFNHVASGLATGETTVTYHWDLQNPAIPQGINVDVANAFHQEFTINGDTSNDTLRQRLLGDDGSAEESNVWEQVANTTGISAVKSIQLANQRGIPVFTITSSNAATLIPQLTIDPSTVAAIQTAVNGGATVIVPRDPTPLNKWNGVGYISRQSLAGGGFSEAYIIAGGLQSSDSSSLEGGSGTGDPNSPNFNPGNPDSNQTTAGDPVNVANGDVNQAETDLVLPGIGLSLEFTRRYDSQNTVDIGLGVGWTFDYSDHLTFPGDGSIVWNDSQGHTYTFMPDGQGGFVTPPTIFGTLTASDSGYTYRDKNGLVHQFDLSGKLTEIIDRNGNALDIAYDVNNHIVAVTEADASERQLLFTYTGSHITAVSDGTGRTWSYDYSGGELVEVDAPSDAQTPQAVESYSYYTDAALGGLLRQVTLPNGGKTEFTYYGNRRAYQVTDPAGLTDTYSFNIYRDRTAFTDARGNITLYDYNSAGDVVAMQQPNLARESFVWQNGLKLSATDVFGQTESYQYDAQGNVTQITDRAGNVTTVTYDPVFNEVTTVTAPGGRVTQYLYDAHGNATQITDAVGDVTTMTYDSHGLVQSVTKPRGNLTATPGDFTTSYTYNDAGQILTISTDLPSTETFAYDNRGHLISATDADGHTTTYAYDLLDRLIHITDALGGQRSFVYDAIGSLIATTDALGRTTTFTYDIRRELVTTTNADGTIRSETYDAVGNLVTRTDELGRTTTAIFDAENRPIDTVYADGTMTQVRYDGGGRIVASTDANGNTSRFTYDKLGRFITSTDALGQTTTLAYDAVGNLLSITDPLNRTTQYRYDLLNRQTEVIDPLGNATVTAYDADGNVSSVTDPLNNTTHYTYDVRDHLIATTNALNQITTLTYDAAGNQLSVTDPDNNTTTYTYDALNRRISQTNALNVTQTFAYDAVGNLISTTDGDGRTRVFTYDVRNRQTSEQWLDSNGQAFYTFHYSYDAAGELTAASDPNSAYTYTYDLIGRVASVDNNGTPGTPDVVLSYAYDSAGNLLSVADTINGVAGGIDAMVYDALNRVIQITQSGNGVANERVNLSYNAGSQLTNLARFFDLGATQAVAATSYTYDGAGRLTAQTDSTSTATIAQYTWTYDAASRVTQETSPDGTSTNSYDSTNQLVAADNSAQPNEAYSYDANGNRTNTGYQTGPNNQLLSDGQYTYAYDGAGNLIKRTEIATGNVTEYSWDYRNRLTSVVSLDASGNVTQKVDYTYDVFDRRIAKSVDPDGAGPQSAAVTRFVYNGNNIALQFNGSGVLTDRYLYGPSADQIFADQNAINGVLWSLTDNLGSIRNLINSSGAIVDHIQYSSFGQITSESNAAIDFLFAYAGQQLDRETGLQDDGVRYYNPATGRFLSQDPLSFLAGDANLYRYVGNQPTDLTDPSGLTPWYRNPWVIGGAIVAGSIGLAILTGGLSLIPEAEVAADAGLAAEVAAEADSGVITVLGHYPDYVNLAEEIGANYFSVPTAEWDAMTTAEQWAMNQEFLDAAVARGDIFRLATALEDVRAGSFFEMELNYLFDLGFELSEDGLWLF